MSRVISGYQQDGSFNHTFSYDAWGNMKTSGTNNFNPNYDGNNRIQGPGTNCAPSTTYCYDVAGNNSDPFLERSRRRVTAGTQATLPSSWSIGFCTTQAYNRSI